MTPDENYQPFRIPFDGHFLAGDTLSRGDGVSVLVLHGGGDSGRMRMRAVRERLFLEGISSCAFDFIGHGETGGNLKESSLYQRTLQALRVVESQKIAQPVTIIAASMGAYTAVRLLKHIAVDTLILLVPAMYAACAYRTPFGRGFTAIIREPESWHRSDAWEILSGYRGRLFLVAAEKDTVIPSDVIDRISGAAANTKEFVRHTVSGAPHAVFTYLRSVSPDRLERIMRQMIDMIGK
ncbi:MAG: alpha/beta fold hydrolase [Desulfobacteraceae bacterium]|nr:MAG: alpha/beta fold hydrolase [Desulfobacteraceae bacterium]